MSLVGVHVPVGKGLVKGAWEFGSEIGCEALQVFVGNPRGWRLSSGDPAQDKEFRTLCADHSVPAYVHTPYLVNLGSPTRETYRRSVESVRHNLARAYDIGALGVVVHTGSCVSDGAYEKAMKQVAKGLLPLLEQIPDDGPWLLLEPTAGQGRSLCAGIEDLPRYFDALQWHPKVGICLDTCHVFAAGAPLDKRGGAKRTLDRLVELVGRDRLRLVHANDSKDPCGSFRDRHERIGRGTIGEGAFRALLRHPATRRIPLILETPGGKDAYAEDIALVKAMRKR